MRSVVHVIGCRRVLEAAGDPGGIGRRMIAVDALRTAERLEQPADLVIIAVPAGEGQRVADRLIASNRPPSPKPRARYLSEAGLTEDELDGDTVATMTALPRADATERFLRNNRPATPGRKGHS